MCFLSRERERKSTDVDHLSLHVMVRALDTPDKQDLRKLQLLKDELVSPIRFVGCQHVSLCKGFKFASRAIFAPCFSRARFVVRLSQICSGTPRNVPGVCRVRYKVIVPNVCPPRRSEGIEQGGW